MPADLKSILNLDVPVIVRLGQRTMRVNDVMSLRPGSIIELAKDADEELDLLINNQTIGKGHAVKIGENFGLRINHVGDPATRIEAMGPATAAAATDDDEDDDPFSRML